MALVYEYNSTIAGLITNIGLGKCQEAAKNDGWYIYPVNFGVSDIQGEYDSGRQDPNILWYQGLISARRVIDEHTIEFICDIPPSQTQGKKFIREVYLFAEDEEHNRFILCLGQCDVEYHPDVPVTIRMIINILNIDTVSVFKILDTCARDIDDHNHDPNAHPDIRDLISSSVGTNVVISKDTYQANVGDIISANASKNVITITLPTHPEDGDKVTVIDTHQISHYNPIIVHPYGTQKIDLCASDFILNHPGAWVTLLWNDSLKSWCVDIGGRNLTDKFVYGKAEGIYYTNYFGNLGIQRWISSQNYKIDDIVIGSDNNLYICTGDNGPLFGNVQDPTLDTSVCWTPYTPKRFVVEHTSAIIANTHIVTPAYTRGANQIQVYIQGVMALCGSRYDKHTFMEDNSVSVGKKAKRIYFYDNIPANFGVVIVKE